MIGYLACLGAASRHLGLLATSLGRWEEASAHFEAAMTLDERMGAQPFLAHTQLDYARLLLGRGRTEDRPPALALLARALETAQNLGMPRVAEEARTLLERTQAVVSPVGGDAFVALGAAAAAAIPDGLTAREVDVLQRIAAGRTNKEIASQLVLSIRTVERHIANIYTKIGAGSRVEAATYARDHGLMPARPS